MPILILVLMLLMSMLADHCLPARLYDMKQRRWWIARTKQILAEEFTEPPEGESWEDSALWKRVGADYLAAIVAHGFIWSVLVHIPAMAYIVWSGLGFDAGQCWMMTMMIAALAALHAWSENNRLNRLKSNAWGTLVFHSVLVGVSYAWIEVLVI